MSNLTIVTFPPGRTEAVADESLEQWAYGQRLRLDGVELPTAYTVDFSNSEFCGDSVPQVGDAEGVDIPDSILATGRNVFAFVWIQTADAGRRRYRAMIRVIPGPRPGSETPTPAQQSAIDEAIGALNSGVAAAQESASDAEAWAVGERGGEPVGPTDETYNNNAKYYADIAQHGAEGAGYAWFDVHDEDGKMYVTVSENWDEDISFSLDENTGVLEVTVE